MKISLIGPADKLTPEEAKYIYSVDEYDLTNFNSVVDIITKYHWAPGTFVKGETTNIKGEVYKADHYKAEQFFNRTDLIGVDIDEGMTLDEGIKIFGKYMCVIGTTKSHQKQKGEKPACDRFRVIIKLRSPIDRNNIEEYPATYNYLNKMASGHLDKSCKNVARYFNACESIVHVNVDGVELEPVEAVKQIINAPVAINIGSNTRGNLGYKTKEFLENGAKEGEQNNRLFLAVKDMQSQLYPPAEIYALLEKSLNILKNSPGYNANLTMHTIQSALKDPPKFPPRIQPYPRMMQIKKDGPWQPDKTHPDNVKHFLYNIFGVSKIYWQKYFGIGVYVDDQPVTDNLLSRIRVEGRINDLSMAIDLYDAVIQSEAMRTERNPIRDFIFEKSWDNVDRFEALYQSLNAIVENPEDDEYFRKVLKKWFISMIVQAGTEGGALVGRTIINQTVLVLKAGQGKGKSLWLATLVPDSKYYVDGNVKPDSKDHEVRLLNILLWHASEFETVTSKKTQGELKSFFTKGFVETRLPFARKPIMGRQVCSFVASVNEDNFLHDETGNRRYPVIPVDIPNFNHGIDIQQLYAQAWYEYENGYVYYPTHAENDEVSKRGDKYMCESITDMWMENFTGDDSSKPKAFQELYQDYVQWCKDKSYIAETTNKVSQKLNKRFRDYHTKPNNRSYYKVKHVIDTFNQNSIISMSNNLLNKFD